MRSSPPDAQAHPRRHRSRQRERILSWLRSTDCHPSAAEIHRALLPQIPGLSLGTVYRNLEILVAEGAIDEVRGASGAARYDGDLGPHHHFHCDACGRILDVEVPLPRGLGKPLARQGLRSRRVRISFFGLCPGCETGVERATSA